jgi:hypothetical protein
LELEGGVFGGVHGCRLSAIGYWLLAIGCWLSAFGCRPAKTEAFQLKTWKVFGTNDNVKESTIDHRLSVKEVMVLESTFQSLLANSQ